MRETKFYYVIFVLEMLNGIEVNGLEGKFIKYFIYGAGRMNMYSLHAPKLAMPFGLGLQEKLSFYGRLGTQYIQKFMLNL